MSGFFGFFDYSKPGKGVSKDENDSRFKIFFAVLLRKFWKFLQLNILYVICSIPLIAVMLLFIPATEVNENEQIFKMFLFSVICLLYISVIGLAPIITGFTYVLRNYSREQHAWIFSDFFEHIRKNFKQAMFVFLIDFVAVYLVLTNYAFYSSLENANMLITIAKTFIVIATLIYFMMHFYIYQIMVTFSMTVKQIYRNSLILTLAHLPRNLGILALIIIIAIATFSFSTFIGVVIAFLLSVSLIGYTVNFLVQPIIEKHLMAPTQLEE